jgi:hypothetical protein
MNDQVAVILRFDGAASDIVPRWRRAVEFWKERYPDFLPPSPSFVGESERGEVVVVNVFATDQDHLNFGQKMGEPLAKAGLPTPDIEHLRLGWN